VYKFVKVMPKEYKRVLEMKETEEIPELQEVLDG
jgi:glutamate synthase domain-containing protein 3